MLDAMRQLALSRLWLDLDGGNSPDPEVWYRDLRRYDLARLFPYLVEDVDDEGKGKETSRYYTLGSDPNDSTVAVLEAHEMKPADASKLPFNKPSGSQSAALGPLIKRTPASKTKGAGPTPKIRETTLKAFDALAAGGSPWSGYFRSAWDCWSRPKLRFSGEEIDSPAGAIQAAVERINEKRTVFVAYRTPEGKLPGEIPEYVAYLQAVLADTKYASGTLVSEGKTCALCGQRPVPVYSNALRGGGFNLSNLDRDGAFPGLDKHAAWKYYGLCLPCADLLYVFKYHLAADFLTQVAGEKALVIPTMNLAPADHRQFLRRIADWVSSAKPTIPGKDQVLVREKQLLDLLGEERAVNTITILWAAFGQVIDDVRGVVTDVLPSRIRTLADSDRRIAGCSSAIFPEVDLGDFGYDVSLSILRRLLQRPGGKKAQARNDSRRLFDLRRDIAEAVYQQTPIPHERFWAETHETARWHWDEATTSRSPVYQLLYEGWSEKKSEGFLTVAGWIRQLARFLHFCRMIGVMSMPEPEHLYQPNSAALKPYFGAESALDSPDKAFAFILGALYGKLLQVQAARGVNVGANALTWLKRLTLSGKDLPELYVKVREKLMIYGTEGSETVRALVSELGELGCRLGTRIDLDETQTCYFLLLGQSLAVKMMPSQNAQ